MPDEKPLYVQIRDQLEQAVIQKELNPGDKLPSVTALAKKIGVTQATIRRALEDLSKKGYTKCHVVRGTFIEDIKPEQAGALVAMDASEKNLEMFCWTV